MRKDTKLHALDTLLNTPIAVLESTQCQHNDGQTAKGLDN